MTDKESKLTNDIRKRIEGLEAKTLLELLKTFIPENAITIKDVSDENIDALKEKLVWRSEALAEITPDHVLIKEKDYEEYEILKDILKESGMKLAVLKSKLRSKQ